MRLIKTWWSRYVFLECLRGVSKDITNKCWGSEIRREISSIKHITFNLRKVPFFKENCYGLFIKWLKSPISRPNTLHCWALSACLQVSVFICQTQHAGSVTQHTKTYKSFLQRKLITFVCWSLTSDRSLIYLMLVLRQLSYIQMLYRVSRKYIFVWTWSSTTECMTHIESQSEITQRVRNDSSDRPKYTEDFFNLYFINFILH